MNPLLIAEIIFGILGKTGLIDSRALGVIGEVIQDGPEIIAQIRAELANNKEPTLEELIVAKAKIRAPYQYTEEAENE